MSVTLTYPGVYLVESTNVPRSVIDATTSLTAFIGPYEKGPTDRAVLVGSWDEFTSVFGGPTSFNLTTYYAVWQFFLNGGIGAWIVRIVPVQPPKAGDAGDGGGGGDGGGAADQFVAAAPAIATVGPFDASAVDPGTWGNGYEVTIAAATSAAAAAAGKSSDGLPKYVDITVVDTTSTPPTPVETLTNVAVPSSSDPGAALASLAEAVASQSQYIRIANATGFAPGTTPAPTVPALPWSGTLQHGADGSWSATTFEQAALAQVGLSTATPPVAPLLGKIAPQLFNIMCIPEAVWLPTASQVAVLAGAVGYCKDNEAFYIADPPPPASAQPPAWAQFSGPTIDDIGTNPGALTQSQWATSALTSQNYSAATYYPWVAIADPLGAGPRIVPPSGTMAGVYASTDASRGVWKAPAGTAASLQGVLSLCDLSMDDQLNGTLNTLGINCLRNFPGYGIVSWGARTLAGGDLLQSPWKYVPVRRLTDYIEQSLVQSLRWAVFEPNGPSLWSSIALEVNGFMSGLFSEGAFAGQVAASAYQVTCDASTTTNADMLRGVVNVMVGFQPVDPVEFVVLNIQLNAGAPAS